MHLQYRSIAALFACQLTFSNIAFAASQEQPLAQVPTETMGQTTSHSLSNTNTFALDREALSRYLVHQNQHGQFSGNLLIAKDNKVIFEQSLGLADVQSKRPINPSNLFKVGSLTKQLTAAAILRLSEQNKLKLDAPVDRYFPKLALSNKITINDLLDHTAGINRDISWRDSPQSCRSKSLVNQIIKDSRQYPPALQYNFSHAHYVLLGSIIEQVSGVNYNSYVDQEFLRPIGMKDSSMKLTLSFQLAKSYEISGLINAHITPTDCAWSAGGLITTARDLYLWNQALHNGSVVSEMSLQKMYNEQIGMVRSQHNNQTYYSQQGNIDGFKTLMTYQPDTKAMMIALSNYQNTNLSLLTADLLQMSQGKPALHLVTAPKNQTVNWQSNRDIVGNYQDNLGVPLQIVYEEGALTAKVNQANIPLVVKNSNSLYAAGIDNKIRVSRNTNNTSQEIVFFSRDGRYLSRFVRVE
ncbi:serine hydrolase domain-containing protein [Photobacterium sanguinicancri]|uniref:serine hydrolase domain-containing protein n=1 Tax=Photobacterium sanguinicancri TaxID=875932 RepID=UPI0026E13B64|nr:serine hydrolase domain-containing protein [Photobacterium sanguinicancri]MDO6500661.1 serine hydrolase domain-containing protein [Photobacterium sanguinicancri]